MITTSADIFSMGAVLSHTAAWVVGGVDEQTAYFRARQTCHATKHPRFIGSGYEGCFHDSIQPLPIVRQTHCEFRDRCKMLNDGVTPKVLDWVEEFMLIRAPKDRLRARVVLEKFEQLMDEMSELALLSSSGTRSLALPYMDPPTMSSDITTLSPPFPGKARSWSTTGTDGLTSRNPSPVTTAPPTIHDINESFGYEGRQVVAPATSDLVEYLEHNLGGRDQFFFIDDSESMRPESHVISEGFRALACIAQRLDPDQVELAFASQPRKVYKARRVKRLQKLVERCSYRGDGCMMESRMGELIDHVIIPRLPYIKYGINMNLFARKKVSVYIFTNGDWGDERHHGDACGVERPVKRLIEELRRRRLDRTQVSLHFVRFGQKPNGKKHLEHLDDCGRNDMSAPSSDLFIQTVANDDSGTLLA